MRRTTSTTLLLVLALQLLGGVVFASDCLESCPDDDASCPPVCALCTNCTHAQSVVVQQAAVAAPFLSSRALTGLPALHASAPLGDDIFHVPLLG